MKRFGRLVVLAMLVAAFMVPGLAGTASAQDASLCDRALEAGAGAVVDGYTVVFLTGGSGSQIVLGTDGDDYLTGGGGHDVLCGLGGYDVLDGGSGNDLLVNGPGGGELYGASGHDTMIGYEGDVFNGGSGRNETVILTPVVLQDLWISGGLYNFDGLVTGTGFTPNSTVESLIRIYSPSGSVNQGFIGWNGTDANGSFATDAAYNFCYSSDNTAVEITATDAEGVTYTEMFPLTCS